MSQATIGATKKALWVAKTKTGHQLYVNLINNYLLSSLNVDSYGSPQPGSSSTPASVVTETARSNNFLQLLQDYSITEDDLHNDSDSQSATNYVSVNEEETFKPLYLEPFEENTKSLANATNPSNTSQAWDESDESGKYGQIRIQMTIVDASSIEDYSANSADHQDQPPSPPVEAAVPQNQASAEETSTQQSFVDEQDLQRQFFDNLKKHTRQFVDIRRDFL